MNSGNIFQYILSLNPINILALFLLIIFRLIPIIVLAPFLGAKILPAPAKMGLSMALAVMLLPFLIPLSSTGVIFGFSLIAFLAKELIIGILIGFLSTIPFQIASSAGSLVDHQRGSSSLQVTEPIMRNQTSPIGNLLDQTLLMIFFYLGGPFLFFKVLILSYEMLPPDKLLSSTFFITKSPFWDTMITLGHHIMTLAVQFAAPPLVAMLMADVFLGIANRLAPQVQIAFLGMPFKSVLGIALLFLGWYFILKQMGKESMDWMIHIYKIVHLFKI